MDKNEFTIESRSETFRFAKLNAIDLLAFSSIVDFDNIEKMKAVYTFILEHIEVKIDNKWYVVKETGKNVYMPFDLENDVIALQQLTKIFFNDKLMPVFTKSNE